MACPLIMALLLLAPAPAQATAVARVRIVKGEVIDFTKVRLQPAARRKVGERSAPRRLLIEFE